MAVLMDAVSGLASEQSMAMQAMATMVTERLLDLKAVDPKAVAAVESNMAQLLAALRDMHSDGLDTSQLTSALLLGAELLAGGDTAGGGLYGIDGASEVQRMLTQVAAATKVRNARGNGRGGTDNKTLAGAAAGYQPLV